jgi:uncharacterized protein
MKNCIIVHGSNSTEEGSKEGKPENLRHWKPWLANKLEECGINTSNQLYPKDWAPNYRHWKILFEQNNISEDTILVGHSAGAVFILRWLVENNQKVDRVLLIAPSIVKTEEYKSLNLLKDFKFDFTLKTKFNKIVIFYANDDDEHIIESAKQVHKVLGGKLIHLEGMGHFCYSDMGTEEFPELLQEILD